MPDFLPVLIIAIICLVALLIVFGGGQVSQPYTSRYLPSDRTIEFNNFVVSYTTGEENVGNIKGEVTNGIFENEEKRIGFEIKNPGEASKAFLNLKVWQSNFYGKLMIFVNGKKVYSGYPPVGEQLIGVERDVLKENNILEVRAESSGWKIWAPTVYIFDLDVIVDYTGKKTKSFSFELSDLEKEYMKKARIVVFGDRRGVGNLEVVINGIKVYNGITTIYKDFPTNILKTGENTIEFLTEPNTTYEISSAQVILFFE